MVVNGAATQGVEQRFQYTFTYVPSEHKFGQYGGAIKDAVGYMNKLNDAIDVKGPTTETCLASSVRYGLRVGWGRIKLFPTELGDAVTQIVLGSELDTEMPEKVEGYQIKFSAAEIAEVTRLLEAKFGAPRDGEDGERIYRDSPHVELYRTTLVVGVIDGP